MNIDWKSIVDISIKIVGLFTAIFGVYKYFEDNAEARSLAARKAALSYVTIYNGTELKNYDKTLFKFWVKNSDAMVYMQKNGMSNEDYRSFLLAAFEHDDHAEQILDAVYAFSTFYDQVKTCQLARVCDSNIIKVHFCKNAHEFSVKYQPIFAQLGVLSATPEFGEGAKKLGQTC